MPRNPHFDDHRLVWLDEFSGIYEPIAYHDQFDDEWRLHLEGQRGFRDHSGTSTDESFIDDRIEELTGVRDHLARRRLGRRFPFVRLARSLQRRAADSNVRARLRLKPRLPIDFARGRHCADLGCGAGRWTKTLQALGASVKSIDVSEHALRSVRRFNDDVERLDLFDVAARHDLQSVFDLTICWGVIHHTHDPMRAFEIAASSVRPGGMLYVMVYAPTFHASHFTYRVRRHAFEHTRDPEARLRYAYELAETPDNAMNMFDMLSPFYNWAIPEYVAVEWFLRAGFTDVHLLNRGERQPAAHHLRGVKLPR